ncbi:MAG: hypothetical protein ACPG7U_01765 [Holosporaceae bacterium]
MNRHRLAPKIVATLVFKVLILIVLCVAFKRYKTCVNTDKVAQKLLASTIKTDRRS